ncbi:winged helix-turn-helix transcriptional regulator [Pseudomonas sp. BN411]|nr:winged helix-turn-helix transcriptional regulator [Pseudomonas sp. BN411]
MPSEHLRSALGAAIYSGSFDRVMGCLSLSLMMLTTVVNEDIHHLLYGVCHEHQPVALPVIVLESYPPRCIHTLLSSRWTSLAIYILSFVPLRTSRLHRVMPGVSKNMLSQTIRGREMDGLVNRKDYDLMPLMVEYSRPTWGRSV